MAFCFRLSHALFELQTRKKLEKLTENAAESIHGRILLVGVFAFTNLMRWIRPSFQIPNLDKSDLLSRGLFYDRRKNHYKNSGKPIRRIVSIPFMAQAVMSCALGDPANARA